jgi:hypothetical protein
MSPQKRSLKLRRCYRCVNSEDTCSTLLVSTPNFIFRDPLPDHEEKRYEPRLISPANDAGQWRSVL